VSIDKDKAPVSAQAESGYGRAALALFLIGCYPGAQWLWVLSGLCFLAWLVAPTVGKLEQSANEEAQKTGGGGCQVATAGAILLGLATVFILVGLAMAGGS
jgi:hypothetical protein